MITELLEYLTTNKVILVGAAATIGELIVIAVNTYRKIRADKISDQQISTLEAKPPRKNTLLWAVNPINLFRKP